METGERIEFQQEIQGLKNRLAQKEVEIKKLNAANVFLRSLFDSVSEEIMVVNQDFLIKEANKAFLDRYGLIKKDVVGRKCYEITRQSQKPCSFPNGQTCPVEGMVGTDEAKKITYSFKDGDGTLKEYIIIIYPIQTEGAGIRYFLEVSRDVTEYGQLLMELKRSEKRLKTILDTATEAIISIDKNNRIIFFNNTAQRIFGYSSNEVIGKDLSMLIPPGYGNDYRYVRRFLAKKESGLIGKTVSLNAVNKDGSVFPIDLSFSLVEVGGESAFTAVIRDISRQQQMEAKILQSARLAAVGQAVAHVAHEIRNPLMIIGGFSSQIKPKLVNEKDIKKIEMVLDEVIRLEKLVANLGDFTKEYKLVKRPADINLVIQDVLKIMAGVYSEPKYRFKNLFSHELNDLNCDPDKLKQVFINVISNGLEAMPDGGTIIVSTERIPNGVEIRIIDEGTGILEEDIENIFEPFYTTRESGSGLGLAISYKLIEAHKGDIWVENNAGKGTTFTIQLPES